MMGRFGRLGNEVESFRLKGETDPSRRTAIINIIYGNGNIVSHARVELWKGDMLVSVAYSDANGIARVRASVDYLYTLRILGDDFTILEVENYNMSDIELIVSENPYLRLYPSFVNLMKENNYTEHVYVESNREWKLS